MTAIKLNSIEGLMVEKKEIVGLEIELSYRSGFNGCRKDQGNREITLDRDKLAKVMYCVKGTSYDWGVLDKETKDIYFNVADAIIANQSQIIKAVV